MEFRQGEGASVAPSWEQTLLGQACGSEAGQLVPEAGQSRDSTLHPSAFLQIVSHYLLFPDGGNGSSEK